MNDESKKLIVEYDKVSDLGAKVMTVIDENDIVVAQFHGDVAEKILELLCGDINVETIKFEDGNN